MFAVRSGLVRASLSRVDQTKPALRNTIKLRDYSRNSKVYNQ